MQVHLSWGSTPLQRSTESGIGNSRQSARPPDRPSSGFLTLSTAYSARIHAGLSDADLVCKTPFDASPHETDTSPLRSWGSSVLGARPDLSTRQGAWSSASLATVFSASTTSTLPDALPPGTSPPVFADSGQGAVEPARRVLRGLDRLKASAFPVVASHERQPS